MRVLVTGGGGFLGSHLVEQLLQFGHQVRSIGRRPQIVLAAKGVEVIQGDIVSISDVQQAMHGVDVVFHTAGYANIDMLYSNYYQTNVIGTKNLVDTAKKVGVSKFIYTSSPSVVFNGEDISGADESMPVNEHYHWYYSSTKAIAENYVLKNNDPDVMLTTAIRPHLLLGPGDNHLLPNLIKKIKSGKLKVVGDGNNLVDVTFVDNAVHAHILALEHINRAAGKAYFIGQERPLKIWQLINNICHQLHLPEIKQSIDFHTAYYFGWCCEWVYKLCCLTGNPPMTRALAVALAKDHYFSHEAARNDLGYKPLSLIETNVEKLIASWKLQ